MEDPSNCSLQCIPWWVASNQVGVNVGGVYLWFLLNFSILSELKVKLASHLPPSVERVVHWTSDHSRRVVGLSCPLRRRLLGLKLNLHASTGLRGLIVDHGESIRNKGLELVMFIAQVLQDNHAVGPENRLCKRLSACDAWSSYPASQTRLQRRASVWV